MILVLCGYLLQSFLRVLVRFFFFSFFIKFLLSNLKSDIGHRRDIGALSIAYKILNENSYPLYKFLPDFNNEQDLLEVL